MRRFAWPCLAILISATASSADPWKDQSGKARWGTSYQGGAYDYYEPRDHRQEFRRGDCKIERKWERGGEYKEKIKCRGRTWLPASDFQ